MTPAEAGRRSSRATAREGPAAHDMGFARRYHLPRSEEQNAEKALEIRDGEPLYDLAIFDPNGVKVEDAPLRVVGRGGTRPLEPGAR